MRRLILALAGIGILFIVIGVVAAVLVVSGGGLSEAEKRYNEGIEAKDAGRLEEAVDRYTEAINLDPELLAAYINRSNAYLSLCQFDEARTDATKAIDLDQREPLAYINRSFAYDGLGQFDEALQDATKLIELDPENDAAYVVRSAVYVDQGSFDEAREDAAKAIELEPEDKDVLADSHMLRSLAYQGLEQFDEALADADMAIEIKPSDDTLARAYLNRAGILTSLERYEDALDDADSAVDLKPRDADTLVRAHLNRAFILMGLGRYDQALADEDAAIALKPPCALALAQAHLTRAGTLVALDRDNEARTAAGKACELGLDEACGFTTVPTPGEAIDLMPRMVLQLEDLPPGFKTYDSRFDTLEDQAAVAEDAELFKRQLESWGFILGHDKFYAADTPSAFPDIYVEIWLLEDVQGAEEAFIDGGLYLEAPGVTMLDEFPVFGDESEAYRLAGPYLTLTGEEIQMEGHMVIIRIGPFLAVLQTAFLPGQALDDAAIDLATKLESRMESQAR